MGVGAADAEGRDARAARAPGLGPFHRFGQQGDVARRPVDVRGGLVDVQRRGQYPVAHGEDHLDDAGDTGGGLGVTEVGLDGAEQQRLPVGAALAVGGEQGLRLDGVAEPGAGAVCLDGVHVGGRQARAGEGLADDALLGGPVGGGEAVGGPVLVDGGAADQGEDRVSVAAGVGEPLDEQHAEALAPAGAVGGGGEGLDAAVGGESALAAEVDEGGGRGHDGHAARQGHGALALPQGLDRPVQGDQRRGAGRVDGDGGAFQAQDVADAAGDDARRVARAQEALGAVGGGEDDVEVVLSVGAGEDTDPFAPHGGGVDAGPLEGLPGGLQEQSLLGVHGEGLARRDPEEAGVELGGAREEAAFADVRGVLAEGLGVVQAVEVPAAVGREPGDRVAAVHEQLPQLLGGVDPAGEAAAHGDDRDGVVFGRGTGAGAGAGYGGGAGGPGLVGGPGAEELFLEEGGQGEGVGVVEDQGGGQPQPGPGGEEVADLHRGQGVEAEVAERDGRVHGAGAGVAEYDGDLRTDELHRERVAFGRGRLRELPGEGVGALGGGVGRGGRGGEGVGGLGEIGDQRAGTYGAEAGRQTVPVDVGDEGGGLVQAEGRVQCRQGQFGGEGGESGEAQALGDEFVGGHAPLGPGAPGDHGGGQAVGAALLGEGVQGGVRGGVVGLARGAESSGDGGEQDERGEVQVPGQLVQDVRRVGLGPYDVGEAPGRHRVEDAVVEDSGGVDDGGQGGVGGDGGEERGHGVGVGHVAGREGDTGAQFAQFGGEFGGAVGVGAAPAHQLQVLGVGADEPAGMCRLK
ncbi:hypothetical protein SSAG_04916 [Streptomyces sp. Mg1]|nr:hypothetical protein SSAG_04916 [Streptomyces sp. Mg1]